MSIASTATATTPLSARSTRSVIAWRQSLRGLGIVVLLGYLWYFYDVAIPAFGGAAGGAAMDRWQLLLTIGSSPLAFVKGWSGGDWGRLGLFDRIPIVVLALFQLIAAWAAGRIAWRGLGSAHECVSAFAPQKHVLSRSESRQSRHLIWLRSLAKISGDEANTNFQQQRRDDTWAWEHLCATAIGFHVLSLATLAVGLAGWLRYGGVIAGVMAALVYVEVRRVIVARVGETNPGFRCANLRAWIERKQKLGFSYTLCGFTVLFLAWLSLSACLPPWHFDVRVYHLQVPKEWFQQGAISFLPHNVYGNMPLGAEMHALLAMTIWPGDDAWWSGALAGKFVMMLYTPLTAVAVWLLGRRLFSPTAGAIAAVVYLSIPWVGFVATTGLNEGAVSLYSLLAVTALVGGADRRGTTISRHNLILAGVFAGAAVSCKYTAVLFLVVPLLVFIAIQRSSQFGASRIAATLIFALALVSSCGLWLGKNWVQTGNPTYPLLFSVFGGETRTVEKDSQWQEAHAPRRDSLGRRFSWPQAWEAVSRFAGRGGGASPLLLPLAVVGLIAARRWRATWWIAALVAFTLAAWWLVTHRFDRFFIPVLPLFALLAGAGGAYLWRTEARRWLIAGLVLGMGANFVTLASRAMGDNRVLVALDDLRHDEPTECDFYFSRMNPLHRLLNRIVPADGGVLLVGDVRPFDLHVPVMYSSWFDDCPLERLLRDRSKTEQLAELARHRITHIAISWVDIDCQRLPGEYGFSPWVTRDRVRQELAGAHGILRAVDTDWSPDFAEVFSVRWSE